MRRALLIAGLLGLGSCGHQDVKPSPTSDAVLAAQYRAQGAHGEMRGVESQAVMDAYRRDIAKPAAPSAATGSMSMGER